MIHRSICPSSCAFAAVLPVAAAVAMAGAATAAIGAAPQESFLMVKPGDPGATPKRARAFLERFAAYLRAHAPRFREAEAEGRIANREDLALRILESARPALVFAPFPFYLEHLRGPEREAHIVAQVPRFGTSVERYYLVVPEDGGADSLAALRGKTVHAAKETDWTYLRRVAFSDALGSRQRGPNELGPGELGPGDPFELEPSANLADDVFLMTEGPLAGARAGGGGNEAEKPPAALLLDEELKQFFASDDLVWPQLRIVWESPALPREVVVALGEGWDEASRARLREALLTMDERERGRELLRLMRSDGFAAPDRELIARTAEAYDRRDPEQSEDRETGGRKRGRGEGERGSEGRNPRSGRGRAERASEARPVRR